MLICVVWSDASMFFWLIFMIPSVMPCIDLRQQTICQTWMTLNIHMVLTCSMLEHSVECIRWENAVVGGVRVFLWDGFSDLNIRFEASSKNNNLHMNFLSAIVFLYNTVRIRNSGLSLWSHCSSTRCSTKKWWAEANAASTSVVDFVVETAVALVPIFPFDGIRWRLPCIRTWLALLLLRLLLTFYLSRQPQSCNEK